MDNIPSGSDLTPQAGDQEKHSQSVHHSRSSGKHHPASGHQKKHFHSETFFSRHFLIIIGLVFILLAALLSLKRLTTIREVTDYFVAEFLSLLHSSSEVDNHASRILTDIHPAAGTIWTILVFSILILAGALTASRIRSLVLQTISMVIWILFTIWFMVKLFLTGQALLFYGYIFLTTLIFLVFYFGNLNENFSKSRQGKKVMEFILIFVNSGFYFISMFFVFWIFGYNFLYFPLTAFLGVFNIIVLYISSNKSIQYNRSSYILFTILVCAVIPPAFFMFNLILFFFTTLAVLLLLYSKYSESKYALVFSFFALIAGLVAYIYQWVFGIGSALFFGPIPMNVTTFYHGITGSLFILAAIVVFQQIVRNHKVRLPKNIYSKAGYLKLLKGLGLFVLYFSGLLVWFLFLTSLLPERNMRYQVLFSYNCIYFIPVIIYLTRTKSTFLPGMLILGTIISLLYPTILQLDIVRSRNAFLEFGPDFKQPFVYHYFLVFFVLIQALVLFFAVNFRYEKIKEVVRTSWVYLTAMLLFIAITEFDHGMIIKGFGDKFSPDETLNWTRRIPYSVFFLAFSLILLLTGFIRKSRFLRIFGLVILYGTILKILFFDLPKMDTVLKTILLLVLGFSFIAISFLVTRLRKRYLPDGSSHHHHSRKSESE